MLVLVHRKLLADRLLVADSLLTLIGRPRVVELLVLLLILVDDVGVEQGPAERKGLVVVLVVLLLVQVVAC